LAFILPNSGMQYEVKNLITDMTVWSGISGPIPNVQEMRRKREQARSVPHLDSTDRPEVSGQQRKSSESSA
jgi:hypothetical protein